MIGVHHDEGKFVTRFAKSRTIFEGDRKWKKEVRLLGGLF